MLRFLRPQRTPNGDDAELLHRFQQDGEEAALLALYDRYLELIYGLCLQYLKSSTLAEDAVLGIYTELQRKVPGHEIKHFKNWLFTFVRNYCLMELRRAKKDLTVSFEPAFMQSDENWHLAEEQHTTDERETALVYCLEQLNIEQKACVQLFYYQGMSYKDIAEQRQESVGKVRSYLQNGRRNLKICIEQQRNEE